MEKIKIKRFIILVLVICVSIGYAVLTANLGIISTLGFKQNTWDVHFEKLVVGETTLYDSTSNIDEDTTIIEINADFDKPGDYMEFSVYAVNDGTVDAMIDKIELTGISDALKEYLDYTITYINGSEAQKNDLLQAGSAKKLNIHLEYKYDIEDFIPVEDANIEIAVDYVASNLDSSVWEYEYIDKAQTFYVPKTGNYKIELWGASGGTIDSISSGKGGYTSGRIDLNKNEILYIYVGSKGDIANISKGWGVTGTFNCGVGARADSFANRFFGTGGGATDIRLISGSWDNFDSLKSRIMVAGAGGGNFDIVDNTYSGGASGGLIGYNGIRESYYGRYGIGGTQTEGGYTMCEEDMACFIEWNLNVGKVGIGGFGSGGKPPTSIYAFTGGGSGYYGGGSSMHTQTAGGGSSYISGHNGCIAITEDSTSDNIKQRTGTNEATCSDGTTDSKCSEHYSEKVFTNTVMIDGKGYNWTTVVDDSEVVGMPTHDGTGTMVGNVGNGYAKITYIG